MRRTIDEARRRLEIDVSCEWCARSTCRSTRLTTTTTPFFVQRQRLVPSGSECKWWQRAAEEEARRHSHPERALEIALHAMQLAADGTERGEAVTLAGDLIAGLCGRPAP